MFERLMKGTPAVREQMRNSRLEMDVHLKAACEQLIRWATHEMAGALLLFLEKCTALVGPLPQPTRVSAGMAATAGARTGHPSSSSESTVADAAAVLETSVPLSSASVPNSSLPAINSAEMPRTQEQTASASASADPQAGDRSSEGGSVAAIAAGGPVVATRSSSVLSREAFASAPAVRALVVQVVQQLRERWPALVALTHLYLANADTEAILLRPVRVRFLMLSELAFACRCRFIRKVQRG